jgi:hypothetical protein
MECVVLRHLSRLAGKGRRGQQADVQGELKVRAASEGGILAQMRKVSGVLVKAKAEDDARARA